MSVHPLQHTFEHSIEGWVYSDHFWNMVALLIVELQEWRNGGNYFTETSVRSQSFFLPIYDQDVGEERKKLLS